MVCAWYQLTGHKCYATVMENQRDVCLVKYNITSNLLLSNSGLLEVIIDVTKTMTFSLHAGNEAGTTPLRVPPTGAGLSCPNRLAEDTPSFLLALWSVHVNHPWLSENLKKMSWVLLKASYPFFFLIEAQVTLRPPSFQTRRGRKRQRLPSEEDPSLSPSSTASDPGDVGQISALLWASTFSPVKWGVIMTHFTGCLLQSLNKGKLCKVPGTP